MELSASDVSCLKSRKHTAHTYHSWFTTLVLQVASLASLAQLLPPRSPTVSNPAPDSSLCSSPIASACPPDCVPFSCCMCSPLASASNQLLLPRARLHPLQLLLPVCVRFQLLLPYCARFSCCSRSRPLQLLLARDCSPIACIDPLAPPAGFQSNVLEHSSRSSRFKLQYEGRASL